MSSSSGASAGEALPERAGAPAAPGTTGVVEFPLSFEHGLLFGELDGRRCLLDTGSPVSFGEGGPIEVLGRRYGARREFLGVDLAAVREHVPCGFDLLIGADLLCTHALALDVPRGVGALSLAALPPEPHRTEVELLLGIPRVRVRVGGREVPAFLDTGASHTYLPPECLPEDPRAETVEDFLPHLGRFETRLRPVELELAGRRLVLRAGALPPFVRAALGLGEAAAILGNPFLLERRAVLDAPLGRLSFGEPA